MNDEFTIARIKRHLAEFIARLDEVFKALEDTDKTTDEIIAIVERIQSDILGERGRALSSNNPFFEECDYISALSTALDLIESGLASESRTKLSSSLYWASLSAGFYLHHM